MKLSEAIRKGCETTGPWRSTLVYKKHDQLFTCALGAAAVGVGILTEDNVSDFPESGYGMLAELWPELRDPMCLFRTTSKTVPSSGPDLMNDIWFANDILEMSREEIADKLAENGL